MENMAIPYSEDSKWSWTIISNVYSVLMLMSDFTVLSEDYNHLLSP